MSNPQQNLLPNTLNLKDLLDLHKKDILLNLNSQHLAKVQTFNPVNQTATATINYKQTYSLPNPVTGVYADKLVDYPLLADCPVVFLGGGNGALTFPVKTGDDCIVLFNDRDIDNWFSGNSSTSPATPRLHSFSDGVILVGLRSLNGLIPAFDTDGIALRTKDGLTKIKIAEDGSKVTIEVGPALSFELDATGQVKITNPAGELIQTLFTLLSALPVSTVLGLPVVPPPTYATDLAILGTFV